MEMVSSQGFTTFDTFLVSEHSSIHLVQVDQLFVSKKYHKRYVVKKGRDVEPDEEQPFHPNGGSWH